MRFRISFSKERVSSFPFVCFLDLDLSRDLLVEVEDLLSFFFPLLDFEFFFLSLLSDLGDFFVSGVDIVAFHCCLTSMKS